MDDIKSERSKMGAGPNDNKMDQIDLSQMWKSSYFIRLKSGQSLKCTVFDKLGSIGLKAPV